MSGTAAPPPSVPTLNRPQGAEKNGSDAAVEALLEQYEDLKLASQKIDEFFVWPEELRPDIAYDKFDLEIPVIDISPALEFERLRKEIEDLEGQREKRSGLEEEIKACEAAKSAVQRELRAACEEYGFFQIVNHGIPMQLVEQVTDSCQHIFDLPLEEKMKVKEEFFSDKNSKPGYNPMKRSNAYNRVKKSHVWNEAFDVDSPEIEHPGRLEELTHILWPDEPENTRLGHQLRSSSEEYGKQLSKVATILLDLMVASLGLPEGSANSLLGCNRQDDQIYARLRINHYPACVQPKQTWGVFNHTDATIMTVLHQDAVGGLQVRFKDGSWHGIQPVAGAFAVNVGDFLQVWTNRRFLSAEHRAVTNEKSGRVSIAYFVGIFGDHVVNPRPELVDAEHPQLYRPFTVKEYFKIRLGLDASTDRDQILDRAFGIWTSSVSDDN